MPVEARLPRVIAAGRIEPHDIALLVDHLQAAADMHRRGRGHEALLDDRELGGAAADVDVEDALAAFVRRLRGAGAVGGEHRFHVMAGGGADEIAALLRQQLGDAFGVLAPQRLAGEDHGAGVDLGGIEPGGLVGVVDDALEALVVDALLAGVGRQRHRRLIERLAGNHVVAAGQVLAVAAQVDAREDHLRAGRADVDADAHQRDVVLQPDGIFFQRPVFVELEMIVVVVVVRAGLVLVDDVGAEEVVAQTGAGLFCLVVPSAIERSLLGHEACLNRPPGERRAGPSQGVQIGLFYRGAAAAPQTGGTAKPGRALTGVRRPVGSAPTPKQDWKQP